MSNLSIRLQELMIEAEVNQSELAEATGISHSNISEFLSEKHVPCFDSFIALLYYFNCSADYLLGIKDIHSEDTLHSVLPFHERLREIMKERKITQAKMIREMPVYPSVLYKWISGKSKPNADSLVRIAAFLECSVDYLIGRVR